MDDSTAALMPKWAEVVGADVAAHCELVRLRDGVLKIRADSTAWATQVRLLRHGLTRAIEQRAGFVVREVEILGPPSPRWHRGRRQVPEKAREPQRRPLPAASCNGGGTWHAARPCSLYRFLSEAGELLYVGITTRREQRSHEHSKDKPWWTYVTTTTWEHYTCVCKAEQAEQTAIRDERPLFNVAHAEVITTFRAWCLARARAQITTTRDPEYVICWWSKECGTKSGVCGRRRPFRRTRLVNVVTCPACRVRIDYELHAHSVAQDALFAQMTERPSTSFPSDPMTSFPDDVLPVDN